MRKNTDSNYEAKNLSVTRKPVIIAGISVAILLTGLLLLLIHLSGIKADKLIQSSIPPVTAQFETKPVPQAPEEDAADDPAIWIHPGHPDSSRIIGTDKKGGLAVYDLKGNELFYYPDGFMNNVDLRYGFALENDTLDILAVTNRTNNTISIYRVNRNGSLEQIHKRLLETEMEDEVYGLCMYKSPVSGKVYVFINNKFGVVEQWELFTEGNQIDGRIVRKLKVPTQVEGMTADDENKVLFVGEEDAGIWKFNAEPDASSEGKTIMNSDEKNNEYIKYDIEGLAIYNLSGGRGYLIASIQGNNTYAVFRREQTNEYLGSFRIIDGPVDGVEITDGLDVTSLPAGNAFPNGLLVVQDGSNIDSGKPAAQNFKLVSWDSVAVKFSPSLLNM